MEKRPRAFYLLAASFPPFAPFLYGPTIPTLSFQGAARRAHLPDEGRVDALVRRSVRAAGLDDIWGSFRRSPALAAMVTTIVASVMARGCEMLSLEILGMTTNVAIPALHALGMLKTMFSMAVILCAPPIFQVARSWRRV